MNFNIQYGGPHGLVDNNADFITVRNHSIISQLSCVWCGPGFNWGTYETTQALLAGVPGVFFFWGVYSKHMEFGYTQVAHV